MASTRTHLTIIVASGLLLLASWYLASDESDESEVERLDSTVPRPLRPKSTEERSPVQDEVNPLAAVPAPGRDWSQRREKIIAAGPARPPQPAETQSRDTGAMLDEAKQAQRQAFEHCTEQWQSGSIGVLTLRTRILGAPEVGTIYESVDVVADHGTTAEVIECLQESMYAFTGTPPPVAFQQVMTLTTLGRRPEGLNDEQWQKMMFRAVVGAHLGDLSPCDTLADGHAGMVELSMHFTADPAPSEVEVVASTLPPLVALCVTDEARAWQFPRLLEGEFSYRFELPILEPI